MQDVILILSDDLSLAGLIARTLRLQQVFARPLPLATPAVQVLALCPKGIIVATPQGASPDPAFPDPDLFSSGIPILALGNQTAALCQHFGGATALCLPSFQTITLGLAEHPLLADIVGGERVLHDVSCLVLPEVLAPIATATEQAIGFAHRHLPLFALQYPIEHNDPDAAQLLLNFATRICNAPTDWDEHHIITQAVEQIRTAAGENRLLCAVSGGVDSMVSLKLASLAVGEKLHCLFVDTGLLREGQAAGVVADCQETIGQAPVIIDASSDFIKALADVSSPQGKKRVCLSLLQQTLRQQLAQDPSLQTLLLGTILSDTLRPDPLKKAIDHEVSGFQLVEPLRDLYKEEVRRLGTTLGLPDSVVTRQSFPATGLALRILGPVTPARLALLRKADSLFVEELAAGGHDKKLWQSYATVLEDPAEQGRYLVMLRALQTTYAARLPFDLLERITQRILEEIPDVLRVSYDLTPSMQYRPQE